MNEHRFTFAVDDVAALIASLPANLQKPGSGIRYDSGDLVTTDDNIAAQLQNAIQNLPAARKTALKAYAASVRYNKETGGKTVNGAQFPTDRETQGKYAAAVLMAQLDATVTFNWKTPTGFVHLDAQSIVTVAKIVGAYVQACFDFEATLDAQIDAGTIASQADIDGAAWPA